MKRGTHCRHGHLYAPENIYTSRGGVEQCRACRTISRAKRGNARSTAGELLGPDQIRRMRAARAEGIEMPELCERFGVSRFTVAKACRGVEVAA